MTEMEARSVRRHAVGLLNSLMDLEFSAQEKAVNDAFALLCGHGVTPTKEGARLFAALPEGYERDVLQLLAYWVEAIETGTVDPVRGVQAGMRYRPKMDPIVLKLVG